MGRWEAGCLKYVIPLEKARQKILQLLDKVASGELKCFAVSLHEGDDGDHFKQSWEGGTGRVGAGGGSRCP